MAQGVSNAMGGMYKQLQRAFKMNSSLGKFFAATNGILQGCALSAICINALMSIWMKQVDETAGAGYEVTVQALPPIPRANQDVQTVQRSNTLTVGAAGYADDCYLSRQTVPELEAPMQMTSRWLQKQAS